MMAAVKAKQLHPDCSVSILEKQNRIGRKLLSTGNGRCNLTNTAAERENYNGTFDPGAVLKLCPPERVIAEFNALGLEVYTDSENRVYPVSNHAGSVLDILRFRLEALGVEVITDCAVKSVNKKGKDFSIDTNLGEFSCDRLIVSTGSRAAPKLGADGSGINILRNMGVKISPLSPALCPIKVEGISLAGIKGIRAKGSAALYDGNSLIKEEYGEIQFTERSLSGICVFNLSSKLKNCAKPTVRLDLMPDYGFDQVKDIIIKNRSLFAERTLEDIFTGVFHKRLGVFIAKSAGIAPLSRLCSSLKASEINALAGAVKSISFNAVKVGDFENAQVTSGGVLGSEINPETMESLRIKGLFVTGETLDADGDCGGFNLQLAFASGILAGESL